MLPSNRQGRTPIYDLEEVQRLVGQGVISSRITMAATLGAAELGMREADIVAAVLALTPACFYKSMEAEKETGLWQDVYHLQREGAELYIKLQINAAGLAVVIQCKAR
jgi:motility quorum-sensing regulator/GCU-specific mRNA interferase toxin